MKFIVQPHNFGEEAQKQLQTNAQMQEYGCVPKKFIYKNY